MADDPGPGSAGDPAPSPAPLLPEAPVAPVAVVRPLEILAVLAAALLLGVSAYAGPSILGLAVALCGMVVAWGWPGLLALPSPLGTSVVMAFGTAAAVVAAVSSRTEPFLRWVPAALGLSLAGAFAHELARRDGRPRLVESLSATITGVAVVAGGASLLPLPLVLRGPAAVCAALGAVAAGALMELTGLFGSQRPPRLRRALPVAGVLLGLAVGAVVGGLGGLGPLAGMLLGGVCACVSALSRLVLAPLPTMSGPRSQLVSGTVSVLVCGVVAYLLTRVLVA